LSFEAVTVSVGPWYDFVPRSPLPMGLMVAATHRPSSSGKSAQVLPTSHAGRHNPRSNEALSRSLPSPARNSLRKLREKTGGLSPFAPGPESSDRGERPARLLRPHSGQAQVAPGAHALPGDAEGGWKRPARVCNAARWMCRIVCADFSWWRLNWLFGSSCFEVRRA